MVSSINNVSYKGRGGLSQKLTALARFYQITGLPLSDLPWITLHMTQYSNLAFKIFETLISTLFVLYRKVLNLQNDNDTQLVVALCLSSDQM